MSKCIIFCADGTWNGPGQDDNHDKAPDPTNVYKLFACLAGQNTVGQAHDAEQEKRLQEQSNVLQVAKYIHGVGDSDNPVNRVLGGVFGAGIIARIVRGYTFISREYEPGDAIVVVGFSRGAYTARALAGMIADQGLLAKHLTTDKENAYKWGARAWYYYRNGTPQGNWWARLATKLADLPDFFTSHEIKATDFVVVDKLKAVAVWDTVGALGFPDYHRDSRADVFQFTNTRLSNKVEKGLHAVALDEQRVDFTPTLWDQADHVEQTLFPGAHADVGGGYTTLHHESDLSDIALKWMAERLQLLGVLFGSVECSQSPANAAGTSHKPWTHPPFKEGKKALRNFNGKGLTLHESIPQRIAASPVIQEPGEPAAPYQPLNLPK